MNLPELTAIYAAHPQVKAIASILDRRDKHLNVRLNGLKGSGTAITVASLFSRRGGCLLCILNDAEEAAYFYNDIVQLTGRHISFFPSAFRRSIKYGHIDTANEILRTEALALLYSGARDTLIVTCPDALAERVSSREALDKNTIRIHKGESIDNMFVSDMLDEMGFELTDYVYEPGQYAMRGSIMDIFSFSGEYPFRIDFFGNEVESIRTFDVDTQLSRGKLDEITVISAPNRHSGTGVSLFDLLPADTLIFAPDPDWCAERIESLWNDEPVADDESAFANIDDIRKMLINKQDFTSALASFSRIQTGSKSIDGDESVVTFNCEPQPLFMKNFDLVCSSLQHYVSDGYTVYITTDNPRQADRLQAIFQDRGQNIPFTYVDKTVHDGFIDNTIKICVFTDHQIFGRYHKYSIGNEKARDGKIVLSLKELNQFTTGDYIVHVDHGIGRFGGLVRTDMNGKMQEAVKLIYRNNDIVFVSIHSLHKLSKYKGKEGEEPQLNKLGSGAWERMKDRTKKKVKDIARDLIRLYSQRKKEKGFAFSADSFVQDELEASFIYEDTPDQVKATADVKADMESDRPMDRLICGDVGFGKTEIAIRAAFKAVADNKQVAVLVPTTVLAFQHYKTFTDRLNGFPCTIDYISRARTSENTKNILQQLRDGKIDILIGTHRIVSKDVVFKDLGLLIIDEEQKFGVAVKEKLRRVKTNVDTLTMTATPIPRTLQFSLMGARDLSNINTPPPNRYPIHTEIQRFNSDIIREAIEFEMSRNGQVFFINNRVQNISEIEAIVRREVPDARIAIGHGQMDPEKLEKTILDFVNYEYDILIATTIIENGIDMPNANTIIINNAHQFGLSELHQLRGRVGRSNRKAFCYLLAPPLTTLTPQSRRRLQAIENFAELGSGIHVAMQDLDIRGAGNILGAEQSGFIADLGYETYIKILEEAVDELKADEFAELFAEGGATVDTGQRFVRETHIESDLELMFPAAYIPNDSERVAIYRELDGIRDDRQTDEFVHKLTDRFGKIPTEGEELIRVVSLRRIANSLGIEKVILKKAQMALYLPSAPDSPYYNSRMFDKLLAFVQLHPRICNFREMNGKRSIVVRNVGNVAAACRYLREIDEIC